MDIYCVLTKMSWKECQSTKFIYVNHFFPFLHRETLFKCYSKWTMQCNASVEISWFFHHILRETNFVDCGSAKSAILNTLEALNFDFFALFWRMKLAKLTNSGPPKLLKRLVLELLDSPKLISRKIWVTEKYWIFNLPISFQPFSWHVHLTSFQLKNIKCIINPWKIFYVKSILVNLRSLKLQF